MRKWPLITILYMIFLTYASLKPGSASHKGDEIKQLLHNLGHMPAYSIFAYCLMRTFENLPQAYVATFAAAFSFGVFMEFLQSFVPYRYPSLSDMGLNVIGISVMLLYFKYFTGKTYA